MAFELFRNTFPGIAASAINAGAAVALAAASGVERQVEPIATCNVEPFAVALASAGGTSLTQALPCVDILNTVKVTAIASLGVGADIGVASTNGGLAPVAAASGVDVWRVGKSVGAAAAGEIFGLYVSPRKLSGTVR
jgi:hypothetical protein